MLIISLGCWRNLPNATLMPLQGPCCDPEKWDQNFVQLLISQYSGISATYLPPILNPQLTVISGDNYTTKGDKGQWSKYGAYTVDFDINSPKPSSLVKLKLPILLIS